MKNKMLVGLSWALVLGWMSLIYNLSAQPAAQSAALSNGITEAVVESIEKIAPNADINMELMSHFVRKNAHFLAYLVLGMLVLNALRRSRIVGTKGAATAFGICLLYAISDEVHQLYVPGRSGEIRDVLIDSMGAMVGIGIYLIIKKAGRRFS